MVAQNLFFYAFAAVIVYSGFRVVTTNNVVHAALHLVAVLAMVAAQMLFQYSKKRRCEAEIEEYRQLVMQGVAVAAPKCTQ